MWKIVTPFLLLIFVIIISGCIQQPPSIVCTADVKQCPDGSYVSRIAPSCEFARCPITVNFCDTPTGQQCTYGCNTTTQTCITCNVAAFAYGNEIRQCPIPNFCDTNPGCQYGCNRTVQICNPASVCTNECSRGQTKCSDLYVAICGNYDSDSCLEYPTSTSQMTSCQYGCNNGVCNSCIGDQCKYKKVAVILPRWQGNNISISPEVAYDKVFSKTNNAIVEASYNSTGIVGDVFYTTSSILRDCISFNIPSDAISLKNYNYPIDKYDYYVYIFRTDDCGAVGKGQMPGKYSYIYGSSEESVVLHELGHNFGLYHSNSLQCYSSAGMKYANKISTLVDETLCDIRGGGDPFDIMSAGNPTSSKFQGYNRVVLGWLPISSTLTATDGVYVINSLDVYPLNNLKLLRIPRNIATNNTPIDYYYVDYRLPNDVTIHIAPDYRTRTNTVFLLTKAITKSGTIYLTPHIEGTFIDEKNGISIKVLSKTNTTVTIQVATNRPSQIPLLSAIIDKLRPSLLDYRQLPIGTIVED